MKLCEDDEARKLLGTVCDLYALSGSKTTRRGSSSTGTVHRGAAKAVTRAINDRCRVTAAVCRDAGRRIRDPRAVRYAEMLHPEHIPDAGRLRRGSDISLLPGNGPIAHG